MKEYSEYVRTHLSYNSESGVIGWCKPTGGRAPAVAGNIDSGGYRRIKCKGHKILAHRIAWFLHYGEWPNQPVDHINGDRLDNSASNLRLATQEQNQQNSGERKSGWRPNTSGWKGVSWNKKGQNWQAEIRHNGKHTYLGSFSDVKEAAEEYIFAALEFHDEFARFE